MRTKIIVFTLLVSTASLLAECQAQPANKHDNDTPLTTDVKQTDTITPKNDPAAVPVFGEGQKADTTASRGEPYKGFVYVKDMIPDLIEDLRYFTENNFMGERADGYEANTVILTKEAATALSKAADELREKGYVIKIYDAYRPQKAVDHFVRWSKTNDQRNKKDYYPTLSKKSLFPGYIARKSGHSRGSTIDMTICYKDTGEEVDMGGHFDYFGPPSHPTFTGKYSGGEVTRQHQQKRLMLREVMVRHGFKPYNNEWWHFTLKNEPYPTTYFEFPVK